MFFMPKALDKDKRPLIPIPIDVKIRAKDTAVFFYALAFVDKLSNLSCKRFRLCHQNALYQGYVFS